MGRLFILRNRTPVETSDIGAWVDWMEEGECGVGWTELHGPDGVWIIRTSFDGMDWHQANPGHLFATRTAPPSLAIDVQPSWNVIQTYADWSSAAAGHEAAVRRARLIRGLVTPASDQSDLPG